MVGLYDGSWDDVSDAGAALPRSGEALTGAVDYPAFVSVASTTDIGAATGNFINITGTIPMTAPGTANAGGRRPDYGTDDNQSYRTGMGSIDADEMR